MFSLDSPINKLEEDTLDRSDFCRSLATSILNYQYEDSFVIGLYGKWGYGKTSVINMILDALNKEFKQDSTSKLIILKFEAWSYSNQNQLVFQFFKNLLYKINEYSDQQNIKIETELIDYIKNVLPLSHRRINDENDKLFRMLEGNIDYPLSDLYKETVYEKIKDKVNESLINLKKKILIIIDDLDRLSFNELNLIFQLVKSIGNFSNTIYFLSFDKSVVVNSLEENKNVYGEQYLEKIIQFPIELPFLSQYELDEFFNDKIGSLIDVNDLESFDQNRWAKAYYNGVNHYVNTIRDIIRFSNSFQLFYSMLKKEVNLVDLLVITCFHNFDSKLFEIIRTSKDLFTGGVLHSFAYLNLDQEKEQQKLNYEGILNSLKLENREVADKLLRLIFPIINRYSNNASYNSDEVNKWSSENRICMNESFDLYFKLVVSQNFVSENSSIKIIEENKTDSEMFQSINALIENGAILSFLDRIIKVDFINLKKDNLIIFITTLFNLGDEFSKDQYGNIAVNNGVYDKIYLITENILKLFTQNKRNIILKSAISNSRKSLYTFTYFVSLLDHYQSKKTQPESEMLVSNSVLDELKKYSIHQLKNWAKNENIFKQYNFAYILYRWRRWGIKEELNDFIDEQLRSTNKTVRLISKFVYTVNVIEKLNDAGELRFDFYYNDFKKFIPDLDKIYDVVKNLKESKISGFTKLEQEGIKLFVDYKEEKLFPY